MKNLQSQCLSHLQSFQKRKRELAATRSRILYAMSPESCGQDCQMWLHSRSALREKSRSFSPEILIHRFVIRIKCYVFYLFVTRFESAKLLGWSVCPHAYMSESTCLSANFFSQRRSLPRRLICSACVIFFFLFFKNKPLSKANSGSTGPIFTKFSLYSRYLIVNYWSDILFPVAERKLPWQPILGST